MKRSSQVALLLMGVTGVGATGYALTKPPPNCVAAGQPGRNGGSRQRQAHASPSLAHPSAPGRRRVRRPVELDADQQQLEQQRVAAAGLLAHQHVDRILDLGAAQRVRIVDQHQHVAHCPDHHVAQRLRLDRRHAFIRAG